MTLEFTRRVEVTLRLNGRDLTTIVSPFLARPKRPPRAASLVA